MTEGRVLVRRLAQIGYAATKDEAKGERGRAARAIRANSVGPALRRFARSLVMKGTPEHEAVGEALLRAVREEDYRSAFKLVWTAGRGPDLRSEKVVSRRYGVLWIGIPKCASTSITKALMEADREAELITNRSLGWILRKRPEVQDYFRFAFMRDPVQRVRSAHADKHALAMHDDLARRWFIEPWYGLETGMSLRAFCQWLTTPWASDTFADRHWLSQHRQMRDPAGRLPDFIGKLERMEQDWQEVCRTTGMALREVPWVNMSRKREDQEEPTEEEVGRIQDRYREDMEIGKYDG